MCSQTTEVQFLRSPDTPKRKEMSASREQEEWFRLLVNRIGRGSFVSARDKGEALRERNIKACLNCITSIDRPHGRETMRSICKYYALLPSRAPFIPRSLLPSSLVVRSLSLSAPSRSTRPGGQGGVAPTFVSAHYAFDAEKIKQYLVRKNFSFTLNPGSKEISIKVRPPFVPF